MLNINQSMSTKPIERVAQIIEQSKISISAFEKECGLSNGSIQSAIKRNTNLKDETLNSILKSYPDVSAEWLLTGKGSMKIDRGFYGLRDLINEDYKLSEEEINLLVGILDRKENQLIKNHTYEMWLKTKHQEGAIKFLQKS